MRKKRQDLLYDMEAQYEKQNFFFEASRREVYYSALVRDLVKNNRSTQKLKYIFFAVVCLAFLGVCVLGMWTILCVAQKEDTSDADIGALIASLGSVLSSIIILPRIVAKHLFPANNTREVFDFLKDMRHDDASAIEEDDTPVIEVEEENSSEEQNETIRDCEEDAKAIFKEE